MRLPGTADLGRMRTTRRVVPLLLLLACLAAVLVPMPAPRAAAATTPVLCSSGSDWNGLNNPPNTWRAVSAGSLTFAGKPAYDVNGSGTAVRWGADPYGSYGWRQWLLSLKWVGSLVNRGTGRSDIVDGRPVVPTPAQRRAAIDTAVRYARDYVAHVPIGTYGAAERSNVHHRVHAMSCLLDAWTRIYADLGLGTPETGWLRSAIVAQSGVVRTYYRGAWNQGLDDAQAVMIAACVTGDGGLREWANGRFVELADQTIDDEGVTTEQSVGYSSYLLSRWKLVAAKGAACDYAMPSALTRKMTLLTQYITHGTRPDGRFAQLGDTYAGPVTSRSTAGLPLARQYASGWAFVRSSWRPSATYLTMRYGPGRNYHGHMDHTSMTFWARGHEVLADSGHVGYDSRTRRDFIWSPQAHSVVTARAEWIRRPTASDPATMTLFAPTASGATMRVVDRQYPSIRRDRSVSLRYDLNALLTVDRVRAERAGSVGYAQRWVLPPGWTVSKVARTKFVAARGHERITVQRVPVGSQATRTALGQPFGPTGASIVNSYVGVDPGRIRANRHVVFSDNAARTVFVTVVIAHSDTQSAWAAPHKERTNCVRLGVGASRATMCY